MKFQDELAWVMAMDELQGDIPDPSSFCPVDHNDEEKTNCQSANPGGVHGPVTLSVSGYTAKPAYNASRRSHRGSGSMKF